MKITWYGHACFMIESEGGSVVIDPYAPGSVPGLCLPELAADSVICSHGHSDHSYAQGVKLSGRAPEMAISALSTWHDDAQGSLRGNNSVTIIDVEGLRVVHLGDLGHMLDKGQLEALGRVDVLIIPVGGFYTIDAALAQETVAALKPGIVVPMHYRAPGFGLVNIAPLDEFLRLRSDTVYVDGSCFDPRELSAPATVVLSVDSSAII